MLETFLAMVGGGAVACMVRKAKKIRNTDGPALHRETGVSGGAASALGGVMEYFREVAAESRAEVDACRAAMEEVRVHSRKR